jgi:hypothetical protein
MGENTLSGAALLATVLERPCQTGGKATPVIGTAEVSVLCASSAAAVYLMKQDPFSSGKMLFSQHASYLKWG